MEKLENTFEKMGQGRTLTLNIFIAEVGHNYRSIRADDF